VKLFALLRVYFALLVRMSSTLFWSCRTCRSRDSCRCRDLITDYDINPPPSPDTHITLFHARSGQLNLDSRVLFFSDAYVNLVSIIITDKILNLPSFSNPTYRHKSSSNNQLFVGVLISTQPEFITGLDDSSIAKSNAFGAMGMFIATFALSVFGILRTSPSEKEDIDASEGYQLSAVGQSEYGSSRYD